MGKSEKIQIELVQRFLELLGYEWRFACFKYSDRSFKIANEFSDVECVGEEVVFLELFKGKKILYLKFRITEEVFQKIMSSNVYFGDGIVEDFSREWKKFCCENLDCEI